jgi:hypothetical protein
MRRLPRRISIAIFVYRIQQTINPRKGGIDATRRCRNTHGGNVANTWQAGDGANSQSWLWSAKLVLATLVAFISVHFQQHDLRTSKCSAARRIGAQQDETPST